MWAGEMMEEPVEIRLIAGHEINQARALMRSVFEPYLRPIFFLQPESTFVAVRSGRVIGGLNAVMYDLQDGRLRMGYLGWLYIAPAERGSGLGRALVSKAIEFLASQGCTDIAACVEGDNPSSFKQLANQGFAPLPLNGQLRRFRGMGTLRVWRHASRFFDMGYVLWHKRIEPFSRTHERKAEHILHASTLVQSGRFLATSSLSLVWWTIVLMRTGMFSELLDTTIPNGIRLVVAMFPVIATAIRLLAMAVAARFLHMPTVFMNWDTAHVAGMASAVLFGWPFPVAGNLYRQGIDWRLSEVERKLGAVAVAGVAADVALFVLLSTYAAESGRLMIPAARYAATLTVLDACFFFYPFCGFNASRIRRLSKTLWLLIGLVVMVVIVAFA